MRVVTENKTRPAGAPFPFLATPARTAGRVERAPHQLRGSWASPRWPSHCSRPKASPRISQHELGAGLAFRTFGEAS